ncbi:MAG: aldolase/citrate lyase family protein [Candidatus Sumerlaeia bacterium]|nr:aldolase/citrate lyase family protein [Candidatus Sumerlaeia bacterium]
MKELKARIRRGETLFGCWLSLGNPLTAETVGLAGFDWVLIDLEHGSGTEASVLAQLQALEHTPASAIVRVESLERIRAQRVLDFGAEGVMFPRSRSVMDARQAAEAMRFQPDGARGAARLVRANRFGIEFDKYYATSKERLVGIVQIETKEILQVLDDVASVDGVDVLFVGPTDLSLALGTLGQPNHPRYLAAIEATAAAARKAGKAAGILLPSLDEFHTYYDRGFRFIASGSDTEFVNLGARKTIETLARLCSKANTEKSK